MLRDFFDGVFSYFRAIKIIHQRKLWKYFLLPGLISFGLFIILGSFLYFTFDNIGAWIEGLWPWETGKGASGIAAGILYAILSVGLFAIAYKYILVIALGPFLSPVSEKVEYSINQKRYNIAGLSTNAKLIWRGVQISVVLLFMELLLTVFLYICMLIPVVNVVVPVLIFLVSSYYAGRGNMDFTFERRFNVRNSLKKGRQYKWLALGNGIVYMLMLSSIIGVFFAPILSVVGLTREIVMRLDAEDQGVDLV